MIKTIRVRLYPNKRQLSKLFQFAGSARFAFNWALAYEKQNYENGNKFLNDIELRREFTKFKRQEGNEWLYSISNNVTKQAIKDACNAYRNFFAKKSGFPKFKSKKNRQSFYQDVCKIQFTENKVKLEGLASSRKANKQKFNWIKLAEKNRIPLGVKYYNPRVTFDGLNWYLTVGVEINSSSEIPSNEGLGIDLGIRDLAILSDNSKYKNINKTPRVKKLEHRRKHYQRILSRKLEINKKGNKCTYTKNAVKAKRKLTKISHKLSNTRTDYLHKVTTEIIKRKPSFVCIEDLKVKSMVKNHKLAKSIQQQTWRKFRTLLEHKCLSNNIRLIIADRFYPSSKLCSKCGSVKEDLTLKDRVYTCDYCGNVIDRDYQASINLKSYAEKELKVCT